MQKNMLFCGPPGHAHARQTLADGERCTIALVSAGDKEPFYESLGFSSIPNDCAGHGMLLSVTP